MSANQKSALLTYLVEVLLVHAKKFRPLFANDCGRSPNVVKESQLTEGVALRHFTHDLLIYVIVFYALPYCNCTVLHAKTFDSKCVQY